jgi:hypothetical protein
MKAAAKTTKKSKSGSKERKGGDTASQLIDARIKELSDWRGEMLARVRILIRQADPEVIEEWKWRGVPGWSHAGIICTGETYKNRDALRSARVRRRRPSSPRVNCCTDWAKARVPPLRTPMRILAAIGGLLAASSLAWGAACLWHPRAWSVSREPRFIIGLDSISV